MSSKRPISTFKFVRFIRKNGFSLLMGIALVLLFVSPDAKSWVLQQLMVTGIFNANIEEKGVDEAQPSVVYFNFYDEEGIIHSTASLKGKVVFINFWASWCGPCRAEFPSIEILYSKFQNHPEVYFFMINADENVGKAKAFLQKENLNIPFFQSQGVIPDVIFTGILPTTVVLDKKGAVRFRHEGVANYASEKFIKQIEKMLEE